MIGEMIYQARTALGMSKATLEREVKASRGVVGKWERDTAVPSRAMALRVAKVLGLNARTFLLVCLMERAQQAEERRQAKAEKWAIVLCGECSSWTPEAQRDEDARLFGLCKVMGTRTDRCATCSTGHAAEVC